MKKIILLIGSLSLVLLCFLIFFNPFKHSTPVIKTIRGPVLIDRLQENHLSLKLFYSDLVLSQIEPYEITAYGLSPIQTPYTSFTEGFIETHKNTLLLDAVNRYRSFEGLPAIASYYNYIELNDYGFLSLTGGLQTLYRINLSTLEVSCPTFDSSYALMPQYIYHISEDQDTYYVLSAEANGYKAYWYALDKESFSLVSCRKLAPPSTALKRNQYALDSKGNAYFIGINHLLIITPNETINLPLEFNPDTIYFENDKLYMFSISELFLSYATYEEDFGVTHLGQVNLPNKFVSLVSYMIKNSILYTITYDPNHPLYRNYITLYDLKNNNIAYCLALKDSTNPLLTLQGASLN